MKKQLSIERNRARMLLVIFGLAFSLLGITQFFQEENRLTVAILSLVIAGLLFFFFSKTKKGKFHSFDKEYFYYVNGKTEIKIPLKSIIKIEHSFIQMNEKVQKDIVFRSNSGGVDKVKIGVAGYRRNFKEFKKLVKRANPKADV